MKHYKREYSGGGVRVQERRGKARWVMSVDERSFSEATDERGKAITLVNGTPKLVTKRRTLRKTISDVDAAPGSTSGKREAKRRYRDWVRSLEEKAQADYEAALAGDAPKAFSYCQMEVPAFIEMYIEEVKADGAERSTVDGYTYGTKTIRDYFTGKLLGDVTEEDLAAYDRDARARGLSDTTRGKALRIFKQAIRAHRKQLESNPFEDFKIPSPNAADPNPLTVESLGRLKQIIAGSEPTPFMAAVELALRTGMRVGEICALRWTSVDMESGTITVCKAIGREKGGTVLYEKEPKTNKRRKHKAERTVPGSPKIRSLFQRRFDFMVKEYMAMNQDSIHEDACSFVRDNCYVVGNVTPNREGKYYANPTVIGRTWKGFSQGLVGTKKRRPTFHDLRHTYATYAIAAGIDPVTVASMLGHSDPSITMRIYADALTEVKLEAQAKMDNVFDLAV